MTFHIGDRVMVQPGHPTFHPDWHGAYGHVERIEDCGVQDLIWVRIEGQAGAAAYANAHLGEVLGIVETALIHPD